VHAVHASLRCWDLLKHKQKHAVPPLAVASSTVACRATSAARPVVGEQDLTTHGPCSAHISCRGGVASQTRLTGREVDDKTKRYTIELVPGKQSINTILSNLDKVHTGLRRPATRRRRRLAGSITARAIHV
jgi:hypothetical protein